MAGPLTIAIEPAKALSASGEASLLQEALLKKPDSPALRSKFAKVLNELDRFDETIALLGSSLDGLDGTDALVLAQACFALHDGHHLDLASLAADRALSTAGSKSEMSRAMADQAKVKLRLSDSDAAISILRAALALDINCNATFKRLAVQLLRQGDYPAVDELTDRMIASGVCHSRVLAARTMALASIGRDEAARANAGIDRFLLNTPITPPAGWNSLAEFNSALTAELTGNQDMRQDRFGTASLRTKRLDAPSASHNPLWIALLEQIARTVESWAATLPLDGHPWFDARPERALLRSWCVITEADGHERWHMHPDGWLSGGYYPIIPPGLGDDQENAGNIAFGLPDGLAGADAVARFGELSVLPEPGQLMLFPSHAYHRTYPHSRSALRICVAFDIIPA